VWEKNFKCAIRLYHANLCINHELFGCWQEDNRYEHVSTGMWGGSHSLHIGDGRRVSLNRCFQQLPIYFKNEVAMLFVMLRLMGGLKNDWIIFYLRWSWLAILEWRRCGGRFHVWFDQCEQGESVWIFQIGPRWNLSLCKSSRKGWYMCMRLSSTCKPGYRHPNLTSLLAKSFLWKHVWNIILKRWVVMLYIGNNWV